MTTTIHLEGDCNAGAECEQLAASTHKQLASGRYTYPCSTLKLPDSVDEHLAHHRTARKRTARAQRLGYRFEQIDRTLHEQDVYEINTSTPERQGRPMSAGYTEPVRFSKLPDYGCRRHAVNTYGVLDQHHLRAYAWVYRIGELVMFSSILGHHAHLACDVMYLLMDGVLRHERKNGPGICFYNMHSGGTDGLRYYKERWGLAPTRVDWSLT